MQIKSWQIAALAVIPYGFILLLNLYPFNSSAVLGILSLSLLAVLPLLLLKYNFNKKLGAALAIFFGIGSILVYGAAMMSDFSDNVGRLIVIMSFYFSFSLIIAGIYYFWKKI